MAFTAQITVRFNHVDAAGIVFYPRYYEMLNEVVERWFDEGLGTSFRDLHLVQKVGMPARNIAVDFLKASRLGDVLTFDLQVRKVGRSSLSLKIGCSCNGERRLAADLTLVCVSLSPLAAIPIPAALRERMGSFTGLR
ncbi:MAG: acyl-CoA thioesterase [Rhodospirillaceae bacterium]|nr:acyl-CoA thioesterase [Rhodospirillaceae bacterium]